jgi:hypothetical protein
MVLSPSRVARVLVKMLRADVVMLAFNHLAQAG